MNWLRCVILTRSPLIVNPLLVLLFKTAFSLFWSDGAGKHTCGGLPSHSSRKASNLRLELLFGMERVTRIELVSLPWQGNVIAIIRYPLGLFIEKQKYVNEKILKNQYFYMAALNSSCDIPKIFSIDSSVPMGMSFLCLETVAGGPLLILKIL